MRGGKEIITEALAEHYISDEIVKKLHKVLLLILKDIDFVCRKYGMKYFMSDGTLLGAVRHKGFIPWDDDLDLIMFKDDYLKITKLIEEEFPGKYEMRYEMENKNDATSFLKIYLNNTKFHEVQTECWDKPKKIFVDIFALESMRKRKVFNKIRGAFYDLLTIMKHLRMDAIAPSTTLLDLAKRSKKFKKYFKMRIRLGRIAKMLPIKFYDRQLKKLVDKYDPKSEYVHIPTCVRFNRGVFKRSVFAETQEFEFEGGKFFGPVGYHTYLSKLYGDYMQIPPENKRERHIALEIDFGEYA